MTSKASPPSLVHKSLGVQGCKVLNAEEGIVEAFVSGIGNKDSVGDIIQPGAFEKFLRTRKPKGVWSHDWEKPISKTLDIYEVPAGDSRLPLKMQLAGIGGLYVKTQFNLNTQLGKDAYETVKFFGDEAEWSIGYQVHNQEYDKKAKAMLLKEIELFEYSPVLFGANELTSTVSIKAHRSEDGEIEIEVDGLEDVESKAVKAALDVILKEKSFTVDEKASVEDIKSGTLVKWSSSGGTAYGKVVSVVTNGTAQAEPTGPSMDGTPDNPAIKVRVWQFGIDKWTATDTITVHRASSLTIIDQLPMSKSDLVTDSKAIDDVDLTPTDSMVASAERGLKWRDEFNRGGTAVGVARARDISNGKSLSPETVRRMKSYFARHAVDKKAEGFNSGENGFPSAGRIAWELWGGDSGATWSERKVAELERAMEKEISEEIVDNKVNDLDKESAVMADNSTDGKKTYSVYANGDLFMVVDDSTGEVEKWFTNRDFADLYAAKENAEELAEMAEQAYEAAEDAAEGEMPDGPDYEEESMMPMGGKSYSVQPNGDLFMVVDDATGEVEKWFTNRDMADLYAAKENACEVAEMAEQAYEDAEDAAEGEMSDGSDYEEESMMHMGKSAEDALDIGLDETDIDEKKAVGSHKTDTSDGPWDGPANEARAKSGESLEYYRNIYAWQDPSKDATTKAAWRFIHHEVSASGDPGAANIRALRTGIGVLNGGRGGTTIPEADRRGVYNHLASHLRDAGLEPPALKSLDQIELETKADTMAVTMASNGTEVSSLKALNDAITELFNDNFSYYYKAHSFHWNILGEDFPQYHNFFGNVYERALDQVDSLAEWLRRFDANPPQVLQKIGQDGMLVTDFHQGVQILLADSEAYVGKLKAASLIASELNEQGILNFFAELIDEHQKENWMFKSILTTVGIKSAEKEIDVDIEVEDIKDLIEEKTAVIDTDVDSEIIEDVVDSSDNEVEIEDDSDEKSHNIEDLEFLKNLAEFDEIISDEII